MSSGAVIVSVIPAEGAATPSGLSVDPTTTSSGVNMTDLLLDIVPQGTYKCKWCVTCQYCGSNDPDKNSIWQGNYSTSGPCASYTTCPICKLGNSDEMLIIKCSKCDRCLHANLIKKDDDPEKSSEEDFSCVLCRAKDVLPAHLRPLRPPSIVARVETPPLNFPDPCLASHHNDEGVILSDIGMTHMTPLTMETSTNKRKRLMSNIAEMEAAIASVVAGPVEFQSSEGHGVIEKDDKPKKTQRSRQNAGVGEPRVRKRAQRVKDEDDPNLNQLGAGEGNRPKKKAQRRKADKGKLGENFPVHLQEVLCGNAVSEPSSKDTDLVVPINSKYKSTGERKIDEQPISDLPAPPFQPPVVTIEESNDVPELHPVIAEEDHNGDISLLTDISTGDLLDADFLDSILNEWNDIRERDNADLFLDQIPDSGDILTSQFGLKNIERDLPSMDSKDVEDFFKDVFVEEPKETIGNILNAAEVGAAQVNSNPPMLPSSQTVTSPSTTMPYNIPATAQVQPSPKNLGATTSQQDLQLPVKLPPPYPYPSNYTNSSSSQLSRPAFLEPPSPWSSATSNGQSDLSSGYSQRSMVKWETDEGLGENATISCILYANRNHPELKQDYPTWDERSKQISKIWRTLSTEKRTPYLVQARENRANNRVRSKMLKINRIGSAVIKPEASLPKAANLTAMPPPIRILPIGLCHGGNSLPKLQLKQAGVRAWYEPSQNSHPQHPPQPQQHSHPPPPYQPPTHHHHYGGIVSSAHPQLTQMDRLNMGYCCSSASSTPTYSSSMQTFQAPVNFPPPYPYPPPAYSSSLQLSPAFSKTPSSWPAATPAGESAQPSNYNQTSIVKYEAAQTLGPNATISSAPYTNQNYPELKKDCAINNGLTNDMNGSKFRAPVPPKESGDISVTLTLTSGAEDDIQGMLRKLASVLSITEPEYQVIDKSGADSSIIQNQKSQLYAILEKNEKEWSGTQNTSGGSSKKSTSNNQRSMVKWEADEALGSNAAVSCVLYANINHPELKRDYASWNERAKQISKIWRSLSTEMKAPYLKKARQNRNRSLSRMLQKV